MEMTHSQRRPRPDGAAKAPVSEATFAALLQRTREGLIVRDGFGRVVYANPAAQALVERTEAQLTGSRLTDLGIEWLYEDGAPMLRPTPLLVGNTGEQGHESEENLGVRRRCGLVRWIRLVVHAFEDGGEARTMMLLSDVTNERLRHVEALGLKRQLELELEVRTSELNRALGEAKSLAISIANDLRVPLTHVDGHLGILRDHLQASPEAELSMQRVQQLVRDLRDFASTTHDLTLLRGPQGQRRSVQLALLCTNASKDFLVGRDAHIALEGLGPTKVACDPAAIRSAVTAMISLAFECRAPTGRISVTTTDTEYSTTLRVHVESDPIHAARVLNSTRESSTRQLHEEVVGVRFLLIEKVAELHDGAFWFSTDADGTEFLLTLPNAERAVAA